MRSQDRILLMQIIYHFSGSGFTYKFYVLSFPLSAYHSPVSPAATLLFSFDFIYWLYLYFLYVLLYITFLFTHGISSLLFPLFP